MKKEILIPILFLLTSCQALPLLFQTVEEVANEDAIGIISEEAIHLGNDLEKSQNHPGFSEK